MRAMPNVFVAHPSVPAKTIADVVKLVQSEGKKYASFATPGIGTTPDLSVTLLKLTLKLDLINVPYNGAGPAVARDVSDPLSTERLAPPTPGQLRRLMAASTIQPLPFLLDFGSTRGELVDKDGQGTGLTRVQANKLGNEYQPALIDLDTVRDVRRVQPAGRVAAELHAFSVSHHLRRTIR